jgi:osmoprotectant transport system ATP-binding protein
MIRFHEVTKAYPGAAVAVERLNLEIPSGKITALVGPSGCGKTTSLRMINRMVEPSSGTITIDGRDVSAMALTELRRGIGYVIQQAGLFPNKTVAENIATVPRLLRNSRRDARGRALELMELVGLDPDLGRRYPWQLSGGQQQRVGVARALAADPPVLLMDEPFSAVDPVVRTQLQDELLRLQAELSKTIVFVTHDIDEAIRIGDQIAVFRPGGILAQFDAPASLLSAPADAFVADFLGRDRGYRALGFRVAEELPLREEQTIRIGDTIPERPVTADGWTLIVDEHAHPVGWLSPVRAHEARNANDVVTADLLNLGGTLGETGGSLRGALDAALSSPSGRGVIVAHDGTLAGTVLASEVLTLIQQGRGTPAGQR